MGVLSDLTDRLTEVATALADYAEGEAHQYDVSQALTSVADSLRQASQALSAQGTPTGGEGGGGEPAPGPAAGSPTPGGEASPPTPASAAPQRAGPPPTPAPTTGAARRTR